MTYLQFNRYPILTNPAVSSIIRVKLGSIFKADNGLMRCYGPDGIECRDITSPVYLGLVAGEMETDQCVVVFNAVAQFG